MFTILIYLGGMLLPDFFGENLEPIAEIMRTVSFFFGMLATLVKTFFTSENKTFSPAPDFTDRNDIVADVIKALKDEYPNRMYYSIITTERSGIGKTQLLFKLGQIFTDKNSQNKWLEENDIMREYSKLFKKIGKVHFITWESDNTISEILNLSYIKKKINIVLIDDFEENTPISFDKKFFYIFCRKSLDDSETMVQNFTNEDINDFYSKRFGKKLNDTELERLQNYSGGNPSILNVVLKNKEKFEQFLKMDENIFKLQNFMEEGNYRAARKFIDNLGSYDVGKLKKEYQFEFLKAELLHLENKYQNALSKFEFLRDAYLDDSSKISEIIERIAHVKKHLGDFKGAIRDLNSCPTFSIAEKDNKLLSLYLLDYVHEEHEKSLIEATNILQRMAFKEQLYINDNKDNFHTYEAVRLCYEKQYAFAHKSIDIPINKYELKKSRYVNNCYFIKAEIYRLDGDYENAYKYYQKCLDAFDFNGDFDILTITYALIKYLSKKSGIYYAVRDLDFNDLKKKSENLEMMFNLGILQKVSVYIEDPTMKKPLEKYFDNHIFFIP